MMKNFLSAKWKNIVMANYIIDKSLLSKYLPKYPELDIWNNKCFVSLVGFMFLDTKLVGIKFPFHINFEEVNLRFYVTYNDGINIKRGVSFVKEIVPKFAISSIANILFNEKYVTMKMKNKLEINNNNLSVDYLWKYNSNWNKIGVECENQKYELESNSLEEFISEHYWGYTKYNNDITIEYEVQHPKWKYYKVNNFEINVNFCELYGKEFSFLEKQEPISIFLADGSDVNVSFGRKIKDN